MNEKIHQKLTLIVLASSATNETVIDLMNRSSLEIEVRIDLMSLKCSE